MHHSVQRPWVRATHAALSGLLAGLLAAGPALAQAPLRLVPRTIPSATGAPKVVVLAVPLDAAARPRALSLAHQAATAVTGSGRFELVDLAEALDAEGTQERAQKASEAEAAFKEGLHAYDELDTQKALQQFDKAARAYEASGLTEHFEQFSQARVMKVASQLANGETKAAELEADRLLGMDPQARFSPNYFPPDFSALVEKKRQAVLAQADGTLEVKTGTVPAWVYVDGQYRGVSPTKVTGLTRADHFITALAPGYAVAQEREREGEVSLNLAPVKQAPRLQSMVDRISRDAEGPGRDAAARELGQLANAQQVLLVLARAGTGKEMMQVTALRLDVADGHNWGYATGLVPADGDASQALVGGVVGADTPRAGGPVTHFGSSGPSVARRTAGYVLLATGAALLAGGVYFGLEASSKADSFQRLAQTDPRGDDIRSQGKTFALIADVGVVAGLASAGAGTWLAFLDKGGGSSAPKHVDVVPEPEPRPAAQKSVRESLPLPPPPSSGPAVKQVAPESQPPPSKPSEPVQTPSTPSSTEEERKPAPEDRKSRREREKEEKRKREEEKREREQAAKREREEAEKAKREEAEKRKREASEARARAQEDARNRDDAAKREREDAEKLKREEAEKLKREEAEKLKREEAEKREREAAEARKHEEEKKKKKPANDDDDLRNY